MTRDDLKVISRWRQQEARTLLRNQCFPGAYYLIGHSIECALKATIREKLKTFYLARKKSVAHRFVESLEECKVSLYWHAQAIETLLDNGKRNPAAGIMLALLAEMARNEAETLRERVQSGLAEARRKGIKLGRPIGTKLRREDFLQRHRDILRQLKAGQSVRNAARITGSNGSSPARADAT